MSNHKVKVNNKEYKVILHPEGDGYWVECPELKGCVSQGDTKEEALEMIKDAIECVLEVIDES